MFPVAQSSLPTVKLETDESAAGPSGFDNSIAALAEGLPMPSSDLLSPDGGADGADNRKANNKKKRPDRFKRARQKRVKEIKREVDGLVIPARNKALPLKNVIQGSKTVAAALAAALGSSTSPTDASHSQAVPQTEQRAETQEERTGSIRSSGTNATATQPTPSRSKKNSTAADGDHEETELALGRVTKKPRLSAPSTATSGATEGLNKVDNIGSDYFRRRLRPPR
ncbi:hypothetical protein COOONC_18831 [Cooperia oncophora]